MNKKEYELEVGGKKMVAVFSDLANQANGSVILKCEDTIVMATAVISKDAKGNQGWFNLTVEYLEKYYASGLILGGQYNKREGRPSDEAILSSRIVDRTIRPLFDQHIKNAVQVIITVLSVGQSDPGILAINAASLALGVSDIPWAGPVGAVLIGKKKNEVGGAVNEIVFDPYTANTGETHYDLDLTVCGKDGEICMIEAMTFELDENEVGGALDMATKYITEIENWQKNIIKEIGKPKLEFPKETLHEEITKMFAENIVPKLGNIFGPDGKKNIHTYEDEWKNLLEEKFSPSTDYKINKLNEQLRSDGTDYFEEMIDREIHKGALEKNMRADLRGMDQVRALYAQAGNFSPILHGSGIFYRGETHVFSALTLGGPEDANEIDGMEIRGVKRFMHHYNFPPYSAGETGRLGGLNRREMGHGMLAEKALTPVIPNKMDFPYTIRVVSESTASNGSTSQASICASTLALMDGGVPIKSPVAGIAMGLMMDEKDKTNYKILTDIQGPEDHYGDMDFKVAGTRTGITAIQLDIKVGGIPVSILKEALVNAKTARYTILDTIEKEIPKPRVEISPRAPKIIIMKVKVDQIGLVIGGSGKTIKGIKEKTGAEITIEDDGTIYITGRDGGAEKAKIIIEELCKEWKVGDSAEGLVVKIIEVGAIVALSEHAEGMVHVSEIAPFRVEKVADYLKEGMKVPVKIISVDPERGRIGLSIKQSNPDFIKPKA